MKKTITILKTMAFLLTMYIPNVNSQSQFECTNVLNVSLDVNGAYTLFPEDLLTAGDLSGYTTTLSQSSLTCQDLGSNMITLDIFDNNVLIFTCTANVIVEDNVNPVVICTASPTVELNEFGEHLLAPEEINFGSYDNCGPVTFSIAPQVINCGSSNPTTVTLTVTDASGNSAYCLTNVMWNPYPNPTQSLACNDQVVVSVAFGDQVTITPDMLLEGGPYGCPSQYEVEVRENNIPRPEPIVTIDDTNKVLLCFITDLNTGNSCWGTLIVTTVGGCDPNFTICDTECNSTPLGDCASGHTDQDNVEWPCDIEINMTCEYYNLNYVFTPEFLVTEGLAAPEDASPQLIDGPCYLTGVSYFDQVYFSFSEKWIIRTWNIIYWNTGQTWTYEQRIDLLPFGLEICDTLPWNTPVGDCASGHTDTDGVEWPADITVNSLCVHPDDLAMNPDVAAEDVRPTLFSECNAINTSYIDLVTILNDSTVEIMRTWEVHDFNTSDSWSYVQLITAHTNPYISLVCISRENGDPIPGVELIPGITTDETGCHSFENPDGIVVTPVKDSPIEEGVDLLDKILLMEHVLNIRTLTPYQMIAADLSQNGILTTLDVVLLDKILNGTFIPTFEHNWKFFERITQSSSIDISDPLRAYKFVGVKMGDIDNSLDLGNAPPPEVISLTINDEILNQKEEYMVPFYLEKNERISGYSVQIRNDDDNIDFLNVLAPSLPGFTFENNVTITPGMLRINWIAPEDYLETGVAIPEGTPLFILQFKPLDNTILSETLTLEPEDKNFLKPGAGEDALALKFAWENIIISSVLNPGMTHKLEFYPNPAVDEIHFQGFDPSARGKVSVIDATGRVFTTADLAETLDISAIQQGMYYLTVTLETGENYTAPFLKIRL